MESLRAEAKYWLSATNLVLPSQNQILVILHRPAIEAAAHDPPAKRREVRLVIFGEASSEERFQDGGACVVPSFAYFWLCLDLQEPRWCCPTLDVKLHRGETEERAAGGPELVWLELGTSPTREILPGDPLRHETHAPGANVLVRDEDVTGSGV